MISVAIVCGNLLPKSSFFRGMCAPCIVASKKFCNNLPKNLRKIKEHFIFATNKRHLLLLGNRMW